MPESKSSVWYEEPDSFVAEVEEAVKERGKRLNEWPRQIREYHGIYFRGNSGERSKRTKTPQPKNFAYSWNTRVIPEMAWQNPRVDTEMIAPGVNEWERLLHKTALNQLIHDLKLASFLARGPFLTAQWTSGHVMLAMAPVSGMMPVEVPPIAGWAGGPKRKRTPMRPTPFFIPPTRLIEDPCATTMEEIRFCGYDWKRSKAAIIKEAEDDPNLGWDLELLDILQTNDKEDSEYDAFGPRDIESNRDEIMGRTVWVKDAPPVDPANTPEKGYHGVLYTLPAQGIQKEGNKWLRPPRDFYGPAWGPLYPFGVHSVPGFAAFLGPLTATQEQADSLAETSAANSASARNYKQIVLVDDKNPRLIQQIRNGKHHYVYGAKEFTSNEVAQLALGGISDQNLVQEQREQEALDDLSGLGELQRGHASGKATATENVRAEDNASVRFEWNEKRMYECTEHLLEGFSWYLERSEDTLFPLSQERAMELGYKPKVLFDESGEPVPGPDGKPLMHMETVWIRGGSKDEDSLVTTAKVKIIPKSMSRRGNLREMQATTAFYDWLLSALPLFRQFPEAGWPDIINDRAEALGLPKMAHRIDWELVGVFAEQQYGMQMKAMTAELERTPTFASTASPGAAGPSGSWGRLNAGPSLPGEQGAQGLSSPPLLQQGSQGGGSASPGRVGPSPAPVAQAG